MATQIFETRLEFLRREDKTINGVSPGFAARHPNWNQDNESNKGCWNCSGCSGCFGCSDCSDCSRCSRCSGCSGCSDCSGCSGCSGCSYCFGCSDCSYCSDCAGCSGKNGTSADSPEIPVVLNIHGSVLAAASKPEALNMETWHTCATTHCRAGWVVHLAGEAGYELEQKTSPEFAAMQIYKASSDITVSPVRFYESDEQAMADMRRCAELESDGAE